MLRVSAGRLPGESNIVQALRCDGLCRIDGLLPAALAAELRRHAAVCLDQALQSVHTGKTRAVTHFAEHLMQGPQLGKRYDCKLPLDSVVCRALCTALASSLGDALTSLIGASAELFELSVITSRVGTPAQELHSDFPPYGDHDDAIACVIFLALEDQHPACGPTVFLPGTHTRSFHSTHRLDKGSASCEGIPRLAPRLRCGDAILMDSALVHAGGANTLRDRPVFHFSFKLPDVYPGGRLSSLREELRGRFTLGSLLQLAHDPVAQEPEEERRQPAASSKLQGKSSRLDRCVWPWHTLTAGMSVLKPSSVVLR